MATTVAAESAPVATTPKKRGAPKKAGSKAKPSSHPAYLQMIKQAIAALKERGGSSRQKILQYVMAHYGVGTDAHKVNARVRSALKRGTATGILQGSKGATATGYFRLAEKVPKKAAGAAAAAKKPKPKKASKSAVTKVGGVRTAKKSPAKKSHKKAKPGVEKSTAAPASASAPTTASTPAPKKARGRPSKGSPKKAAAKKSPVRPKAGAKGRGRPKEAAQ